MAKISINLKDGSIDKQKSSDIIVGIDLGTTNSLIAYIEDGKPKVLKDQDGSNTLVPSMIHFSNEGQVIVGSKAKPFVLTKPDRTIYSIKRLLGKSYKDLNELTHLLGYTVIDDDRDSIVKIKVDDRYFTPIELSAEILRELKGNAENQLKSSIDKAVITVPAYFNDAQRQATRDAGKLAGLDVMRIVNEPTAASLAYGLGINKEQTLTVAVYDLGGGTFDMSILKIQNGIFEVLSTHGDTMLGGDDFDRVIIQKWLTDMSIDERVLTDSKSFGQALRTKAEEAKVYLSHNDEYRSNINEHEVRLGKIEFEALIIDQIDRTITSCQKALKDASLNIEDIDEVVLVGGSTRVPLVIDKVSEFFSKKLKHIINPDEVVALGAAIQADILAGNRKDMLLLDITPLSLGIETIGGLMDVLIPRNSKVPAALGRQYTTSVDGQSNLKVAVYQGERDLVEHNRKLGELILKGIPPMPAGLPKIEIQFVIDADGILKVKAKELRSGVDTEAVIKSTYGISEEEMARMLLDSIQNAESDMKAKALQEAKNEAKSILLSSDKFLTQHSAILTADQIAKTKDLILELQKSVGSNDKNRIEADIENLNVYTAPFAQLALENTIKESLTGKKI